MARLRESGEIDHCFFVGDTLHDAEVADALGARCILVAGGHQTTERLAAAGRPVADSLSAAIDIIQSEISKDEE